MVDVAHQDENGLGRDRFQQMVGNYYVHHGSFVHDYEVGGKRFLLVSLEPSHVGAEFEKPVNSHRRVPRRLGEPLGGAAGGGGQADAGADVLVYGENGPDQGGLAGPGSPGYYQDLFAEGEPDRFFLKRSERKIQAPADPIESGLRIYAGLQPPVALDRGKSPCGADFGSIQGAQVDRPIISESARKPKGRAFPPLYG